MTTATDAATLGCTPARSLTTSTRSVTIQPHTSPETVQNGERPTQPVQTSNARIHIQTARAPNEFLAELNRLERMALDGPRVAWAIDDGGSAPEIASRHGIRQSSDAYRTLVCRVENRRIEILCRSLGL